MLAGESLVAGKFPGERIATVADTTSSGTFTAETEGSSVTAALVAGRTYRIQFSGTIQSSVAGDSVRVRIREDSVAGTGLNVVRVYLGVASAGIGFIVEAEYTAVSTGNKTFSGTGERATGTGNISFAASAVQVRYFYVDYAYG